MIGAFFGKKFAYIASGWLLAHSMVYFLCLYVSKKLFKSTKMTQKSKKMKKKLCKSKKMINFAALFNRVLLSTRKKAKLALFN